MSILSRIALVAAFCFAGCGVSDGPPGTTTAPEPSREPVPEAVPPMPEIIVPDPELGSWSVDTIWSLPDSGKEVRHLSVASSPSGSLHLAFGVRDAEESTLWYGRASEAPTFERVGATLPFDNDIAVDAEGRPHLVWFMRPEGSLAFGAAYATPGADGWETEVLNPEGRLFDPSALRRFALIDVNPTVDGRQHVVMRVFSNKIATVVGRSGDWLFDTKDFEGAWTGPSAASGRSTGAFATAFFTRDFPPPEDEEPPAIVEYRGVGVAADQVDSLDTVALPSSGPGEPISSCGLAVAIGTGPDEVLHVAYTMPIEQASGRYACVIRYTRLDSEGWAPPRLVHRDGHEAVAIGVDRQGKAHVVSADADGQVTYARLVGEAFESEAIEQVVAESPLIAFDREDRPVLVFVPPDGRSIRRVQRL